jgi:hypothetical protein
LIDLKFSTPHGFDDLVADFTHSTLSWLTLFSQSLKGRKVNERRECDKLISHVSLLLIKKMCAEVVAPKSHAENVVIDFL